MEFSLQDLSENLPPNVRIVLRHLLTTLKLAPRIDNAQIALTYKCNANCYKCSINNYRNTDTELSTEEVKSLINDFNEIRVSRLGLFGGECLLRKDIFELVDYSAQIGIRTEIFTNGFLLSKKTVEKLKEAGIWRINISIDSYNPKEHDSLRRLPGCFQRAINGLKHCVNNNIPVIINTVATKKNIHNGGLNNLILLAKKLKAKKVKVIPPTMVGCWLNAKKKILNYSDYDAIIKLKNLNKNFVVSEIRQLKGHVHRSCLCRLGRRVYVSCYGDVQPCWAVPLSFGNIRETRLKDIVKKLSKYYFYRYSEDCLVNNLRFRQEYLKSKSSLKFPRKLKV